MKNRNEIVCPNCGAVLRKYARYCDNCGEDLPEDTGCKKTPVRKRTEKKRRGSFLPKAALIAGAVILTVLFVILSGPKEAPVPEPEPEPVQQHQTVYHPIYDPSKPDPEPRDSGEREKYQEALGFIGEGDYISAFEILDAIPDYLDSEKLLHRYFFRFLEQNIKQDYRFCDNVWNYQFDLDEEEHVFSAMINAMDAYLMSSESYAFINRCCDRAEQYALWAEKYGYTGEDTYSIRIIYHSYYHPDFDFIVIKDAVLIEYTIPMVDQSTELDCLSE